MKASRSTKATNFRVSAIQANRQRAASVQDNEQREWDRLKALNQWLTAEAKPVVRI
jgi:hypothetical protein